MGRGGQALGWSTGWLVASAGVDGWVDRDPGDGCGGRAGRREEVARLFVCQPRWDPLPIHSLSPIPRYLDHRTRSTRALPVQLPPQNAPHRDDVYGCVCRVYSICVCMFIHVHARVERSRALIYVAPMCYTLQTSPPFTRGYSMCRICS